MRYWWATQTKNYSIAVERGSLWSCPTPTGFERADRKVLKDLELGDYVFHYAPGGIRAVSRVAHTWVDFGRPVGYPRKADDDVDDGWLVRVAPIRTNVSIPYQRAAELIAIGSPGPLGRNGVPSQKYISPLSRDDGERLLAEAGIEPEDDDGVHFAHPASIWGGSSTNATVLAQIRREQAALRLHLLGGRPTADCAVCGRHLPASLLVAAHIVPRRSLRACLETRVTSRRCGRVGGTSP